MAIEFYLFDMDHTLIGCDCDVTWKEFAVKHGLAEADALDRAAAFFADYQAGHLDLDAFNAFQLREFAHHTRAEIADLSRAHFEEFVRPRLRSRALEFVRALPREARKAVVSSTNAELVRPVAAAFGIAEIAGTELEFGPDGRATGRIAGIYAAGEGKVRIVRRLEGETGIGRGSVAYFGDSVNDIPVLEAVGHPFAVSPSEALRRRARERKWPILDWSD